MRSRANEVLAFLRRPADLRDRDVVFITLIGAIAYFTLPVQQYPEIAPPTIVVSAVYPGASARPIADTVATPIEQQINGVENMLYMNSQSTGDGNLPVTVTFKLGTDLDIAQVLVQNRVAIALPRLPAEVQQIGVTVHEELARPDDGDASAIARRLARPALHLQLRHLQSSDVLARLDGVGDVAVFGARDYSMRVWLDPTKLAARNLTAGDVVDGAAGAERAGGGGRARRAADAGRARSRSRSRRRAASPIPTNSAKSSSRPTANGEADSQVNDIARVELAAQDYAPTAISTRSGSRDRHLPAPRLERAVDRAGDPEHNGRPVQAFSARSEIHHRLQPDPVHPAVGRRRRIDHLRSDHPGRAGGHLVPADLARRDHSDRRHSGVADRHLRRAVGRSASRSTI